MTRALPILRRLGTLLAVIVLSTFFLSCLLRLLPTDLVDMILTLGTPEEKAVLRRSLYLDRDVFTSYFMWFSHFIRGGPQGVRTAATAAAQRAQARGHMMDTSSWPPLACWPYLSTPGTRHG
jgi:ABC-type dipeptide/oligopeptide/nickel transport system permease component